MGTKIAVIESRWHAPGNGIKPNTSVRPLFEFLSDIHFGNHHSFEYEMVGTQPALDEALQRLAKSRSVSVAYLAMHGNEKGLHLHGGQRVTRTHLKNTLRDITAQNGAALSGLYLGSCLFGARSLAEFVFSGNVSVTWIAGYNQSVEFVSSTSLDLLFFNTLLAVRRDEPNLSKLQRIHEVARRLRIEVPGLCKSPEENEDEACGLGFSIFVRKRGPKKGVIDLLRDIE